jgi:hypothetical protein
MSRDCVYKKHSEWLRRETSLTIRSACLCRQGWNEANWIFHQFSEGTNSTFTVHRTIQVLIGAEWPHIEKTGWLNCRSFQFCSNVVTLWSQSFSFMLYIALVDIKLLGFRQKNVCVSDCKGRLLTRERRGASCGEGEDLGGGEYGWSTLYVCMKIAQWLLITTIKKGDRRRLRKSNRGNEFDQNMIYMHIWKYHNETPL